jgi:hypothetical protein
VTEILQQDPQQVFDACMRQWLEGNESRAITSPDKRFDEIRKINP